MDHPRQEGHSDPASAFGLAVAKPVVVVVAAAAVVVVAGVGAADVAPAQARTRAIPPVIQVAPSQG